MRNDGLCDLQIIDGHPLHPNKVFWSSPPFRTRLGFETDEAFPEAIEGCAARLHPDIPPGSFIINCHVARPAHLF